MYDVSEKFHKPLAAASKKLPQYGVELENLFSNLVDKDSDKKQLKRELAEVNKILDFAKITMQKFNFVVYPNTATKQNVYDFVMETYQDMDSDPADYEMNYNYLFQTAFHYAALLYYRDNFNRRTHDIPMLALMSFNRLILNSNSAESDEPRFVIHRNCIVDSLTANHKRNYGYFVGLSLSYLDQQFVIDSYNIYSALSKQDSAAFVAIIDRK